MTIMWPVHVTKTWTEMGRMAAIQLYSAFLLIFLSIAGQSDAAKDGWKLQDGPFSDFEKKYNRNVSNSCIIIITLLLSFLE